MAKLSVSNGNVLITVHGRGSANVGARFPEGKDADGNVTYLDVADKVIYFEIKGILRKPVDRVEGSPEWVYLKLSSPEVELFKEGTFPFIFRDETDPLYPNILWQGGIKQIGWEGVPNSIEGGANNG